jgi:secreted trypsin-like serine protease
MHEDYNPLMGQQHDIALLQLKEPLNLTVYMPACLPAANRDWTNETAWVYGWGTTESGGAISPVLRETNVTIISNAACNDRSGTLNGQVESMAGRVSDDMLCGERMGTDSCQGDSGGPFTVAAEGRHTLAGVVSWGLGCAIVSGSPNPP